MFKKTVVVLCALFEAGLVCFGATGRGNLPNMNIPRNEYPRPQFERADWVNLNGKWTYTFDFGESGEQEGRRLFESKGFDSEILVPFCPESKLSGVGYTDFINAMWYHRVIEIPASWDGDDILINFGAVDFESELYINGVSVGSHFGGTCSFTHDLTHFVKAGGKYDLVLRVRDHARGNSWQPRGKQCNTYKSNGCHYTRTTGIWQTVWLEHVNRYGLKLCAITPDFDDSRFIFAPHFRNVRRGYKFRATVFDGSSVVGTATGSQQNDVPLVIAVPNAKPWSPESPFLYDILFEVLDDGGKVIDTVKSYAGLRKVHVEGNKFFLNNKPIYQRLVLDQGFYPDGIWTAPTDAALKRDIELSMAAGFNGARLHQKVFEERFHYWADRLGYLTWGESSSWGCDRDPYIGPRHFLSEWREIVLRDRNHPSIIVWTPLNETLGELEGAPRQQQRFHVDVYELTKAIDPTRPVNDSSGYTHQRTDLWTIHNYARAEKLAAIDMGPGKAWMQDWALATGCKYTGQPYIIDEFGGLKWIPPERKATADNTWGYGSDIPDLKTFYKILEDEVKVILNTATICGYCYTQLTDVEQEENGIYNYDRTPKFDMARIKAIFEKDGACK